MVPTSPKSHEFLSSNKANFASLKKGSTLNSNLKNLSYSVNLHRNEEHSNIILKSTPSEFYVQPKISEFFENEDNFQKLLVDKMEANKKIFQKIYEKSGIKQELSSFIFKIYEK